MSEPLLREQLDYYRARAAEYDATSQPDSQSADPRDLEANQEWMHAMQALRSLGDQPRVLELAGGTGRWTEVLAQMTTRLTVLDGAPEMLVINRARVNDDRVRFESVDLFDWEPGGEYDLVFFAFWLSHVPPDKLDTFMDKVQRAVCPGGQVFIVDEPGGGQEASGPVQDGMYQQRSLLDGRVFHIVKVYYDPGEVQLRLLRRGFIPGKLETGDYFFHLLAKRLPG